jgi:hypothetical protein
VKRVLAKEDDMGKEARVALVLTSAACLLAVMVEWAAGELYEHEHHKAASEHRR